VIPCQSPLPLKHHLFYVSDIHLFLHNADSSPSKVSASDATASNLELVDGTLQLYFSTLTNLLNVRESAFSDFKHHLCSIKCYACLISGSCSCVHLCSRFIVTEKTVHSNSSSQLCLTVFPCYFKVCLAKSSASFFSLPPKQYLDEKLLERLDVKPLTSKFSFGMPEGRDKVKGPVSVMPRSKYIPNLCFLNHSDAVQLPTLRNCLTITFHETTSSINFIYLF
jgi:hypothetical protein